MLPQVAISQVHMSIYRRSSIVTGCGKNDFGVSLPRPSSGVTSGGVISPIHQPNSPNCICCSPKDANSERKINQIALKQLNAEIQ